MSCVEGPKLTWKSEKFAFNGKEELKIENEERMDEVLSMSSHDWFFPSFEQLQLSNKQQDAPKLQELRSKSYSDVREKPLFNKLQQNKNVHNQGINDTYQHKKDLQTIQNLANGFSVLNVRSESQSKIQPSLNELVKKSKSQTTNSVSGPVNGIRKDEAAKLSGYPGRESGNIVSQGTAVSLADLANQHKSQRAKVSSPNGGSLAIFQKVSEDKSMSQLSAQKQSPTVNSVSDHPDSFVVSSLNGLPKVCNQSGRESSSVSLSQLIQQHSPQGSQLTSAKPSLTSLLSSITLDDSNPKVCHESSAGTDSSPSLFKLPSTGNVPNISLESCLKTSRTSATGSRKSLNAQQERDIDDVAMIGLPSQVDVLPPESYEDMQEKTTHTTLISQASCLGSVLCGMKLKRSLTHSPLESKRPLKYPKFMCSKQVGNRKLYVENTYHKIEPFNFSTPSPDDIVKSKQKQAFTRPDKEFEL